MPQGVRVQVPPRARGASPPAELLRRGQDQYTAPMTPAETIERRLVQLGAKLQRCREELRIAEEELLHFQGDSDEARLQAIVSSRPDASRAEREAQRSVDAVARQRAHLVDEMATLEQAQDELLDQLAAARRNAS